jgi:hypothetical protein
MGLFFSKKRSDGELIRDGDPMMHIMPYMMRGRNESAIYYKKSIIVENMQQYIRDQRRQGTRITMFNIIVSALLHTLYRRPHLNRFVAGRRIYKHNGFNISYIVKTNLTDDGIESIATVPFTENDTIFTVTDRMKHHIDEIKAGEEKADDMLIRYFTRLPRWLVRFTVWAARLLDFYGIMPAKLREAIPLYSSIFFSHLGSLGADAPFHHLYEFGTTSIFITIGKIYDAPYKNRNGELEWRKTMDLMCTIDERICDGYYLIRSLKQLETYFDDPSLLEKSPLELTMDLDESSMKDETQIVFEQNGNNDNC